MVEIKQRIANRNNYGLSRNVKNIKYIVIHYTANDGDRAKNNADYFANKIIKASAHYFVDDDYVYQSVPDNYVAYSVGGGKYSNCSTTGGGKYYKICTNSNSISIELCDVVKNGQIYPSTKTIANAIELTKSLMKKYNIPATNVIRHFDITGKNCLPIDSTELLTKNGWISLRDIKIKDCVAQYNPNNDEIEFDEVLDVIEPYESEVLKNRGLEATYNHRMYTKPNCVNSHKYRDILWGELLVGNKTHIVKNGAIYKGKGLDLSDDELRLLVWIQGDGHYMKSKNGKIDGVEFHLKKKRKITRIKQLLDDLEITYTICNKSDGSVSIRNYGQDLYNWAERWLNNKKFSYNLLEMSVEQFNIFWNEILVVDGNVQKNMYTSVPQINLDVVQSLCATKGKRSNKCTLGTTESTCVMVNNSNYTIGGRIGIKKIEKRNTLVSCVTVPSGYILIRQNNKTFIVGNCPAYWCGSNTKNKLWLTEFKNKLSAKTTTATTPSNKTKNKSNNSVKKTVSTNKANIINYQTWLNKYFNSNLKVDGVWGTNSKKATIKAWQSSCNKLYKTNLKVDGVWGVNSKKVATKVILKFGTNNRFVYILQGLLNAYGYTCNFTGKVDNNTVTQIKKFQKDKKLKADGIVGSDTWNKFFS